ncbi:hypothetical protein AQ767_04710 [Burkholderia pseudomallei]|nr:hypothetical protein AQ767_04710 [Burkholderia pseudomallei]
MLDPEDVVPVRRETCQKALLEAGHCMVFLFVGRLFVGSESETARNIAMLERQTLNQAVCDSRIARQDFRLDRANGFRVVTVTQ